MARSSRLRGVDVPAAAVPGLIDEIPALAVAAAHAEGRFTVSGAAELRVKESDRIAALAEGLRRLGATVEERPDGLAIDGGSPLHGAAVRAHDDHRIAMALAVAGARRAGRHRDRGRRSARRSRSPSSTTCWPRGPALGEGLPERVVLVGFMGSGKSTVGAGPGAAARLGASWTWTSASKSAPGRAVAAIFRERGEAAFRRRSCRSPASSSRPRRRVIATGGGAFAHARPARPSRAGAFTVWLACDFETLARRVPTDGSRPLAADREIMRRLLAEREPFYRSADLIVDAMEAPEAIAGRIVAAAFRRREARSDEVPDPVGHPREQGGARRHPFVRPPEALGQGGLPGRPRGLRRQPQPDRGPRCGRSSRSPASAATTTRSARGSRTASSSTAWRWPRRCGRGSKLTRPNLNWLRDLPEGPAVVDGQFAISHGTPIDEDAYIFGEIEALNVFRQTDFPVCFFGHSHFPVIFGLSPDAITTILTIGAVVPLQAEARRALPRSTRARSASRATAIRWPRSRSTTATPARSPSTASPTASTRRSRRS